MLQAPETGNSGTSLHPRVAPAKDGDLTSKTFYSPDNAPYNELSFLFPTSPHLSCHFPQTSLLCCPLPRFSSNRVTVSPYEGRGPGSRHAGSNAGVSVQASVLPSLPPSPPAMHSWHSGVGAGWAPGPVPERQKWPLSLLFPEPGLCLPTWTHATYHPMHLLKSGGFSLP